MIMNSKDYAAIIVFHTKDLKPEGIKYLVEDVNNSTWLLPLEDQKFYWSNEILRQEADRFTNDASKAWLFGTKEDARAMLVYLFNTLPGYDVTEHEFVAPAPAIEGKEDQIHVQLPSGAIARVSIDASPELMDSLNKMAELAMKMPSDADGIPLRQQWKETWDKVLAWHTDPVKMDWLKKNGKGIPHPGGRDEISPTPPAGAEGGGEIKKAPRQIKPRHITERELSAAQAKIAELEARVNELQEWHDSHDSHL